MDYQRPGEACKALLRFTVIAGGVTRPRYGVRHNHRQRRPADKTVEYGGKIAEQNGGGGCGDQADNLRHQYNASLRTEIAIPLLTPIIPVHQSHDQGGNRPHSDFRRSEEHTSELQSLMRNSYAVFCLKKKT